MDLKSLLNNSTVQKQPPPPPKLHTPQSSFDRSAERTISYDAHPDRPPSYPPALDSRSQTGGYFATQSPAQNSASPPNATSQSIYAQSPGYHGNTHTPRDNVPPSNYYPSQYVPSPGAAPATPGSFQYHQGHTQQSVHANSYPATSTPGRPPTREDLSHTNGVPYGALRQMSPPAFTQQPVTPLGPPVAYPRPSPQTQRPSSQGYDHYRRSSISSIGSAHSRDFAAHPMAHPDHARGGSIQRAYSGDDDGHRERERSLESVSPKTIPRPTPQRQSSSYSQEPVPDAQPFPPQKQLYSTSTPLHMPNVQNMDSQQNTAPTPSPHPAENHMQQNMSSNTSSGPPTVSNVTPQSAHSSLPAQPSPSVNKQSSLKRSNSILSSPPASAMPPRKRPRRDEIPIFAQSARRGKPIVFDTLGTALKPHRSSPIPKSQRDSPAPHPQWKSPVPKREHENGSVTNGQAPPYTLDHLDRPYKPLPPGKEPSITNVIPYEDLVRQICDWISYQIAGKTPPTDDAEFEIEAKLGAIVDKETKERVRLPVSSEAILDTTQLGAIQFASTMDERTHQRLNQYLNKVYQDSLNELRTTNPDREVLRHKHLKESDEFYELNYEGKKALPQSLAHWIANSRHVPKVRKTIDDNTGALSKQIMKLRLGDLEIYNPNCLFDYRVSLSLEVPWHGEPHHLMQPNGTTQDRKKDRISYRHMSNQVDLTQISYYDSARKEHELEVEISPEEIEKQFALLRERRENQYEELIGTFINNVRLLCRQAGSRK